MYSSSKHQYPLSEPRVNPQLANDALDEWVSGYRVRQDRLNIKRQLIDDAHGAMVQSDEIAQLQRDLSEERRRRAMAENTHPLLLTILVFVVCAGGIAIYSHSDFAAYEWLIKMNSVESQMANGVLRLEADESKPSIVRNAGRRAGVFVLPPESAQAAAAARRAARSKFNISHRTFQQFPYTSAAIPNNGSVYDVGGGVFQAAWPAEQFVGHSNRSEKQLAHSNAALLAMPNGDIVCAWWVNQSIHESSSHLMNGFELQNKMDASVDGDRVFGVAGIVSSHGNVGTLGQLQDDKRFIQPPPSPPPRPPPAPSPPLPTVLAVHRLHTQVLMMSRLQKGAKAWDVPFAVWEAPQTAASGGEGGVAKLARGLLADQSMGVVLHTMADDRRFQMSPRSAEAPSTGDELSLEQHLAIEQTLHQQGVEYVQYHPQTVTVVISAMSKQVPDMKAVHVSKPHHQIEQVQTWALAIEMGAKRQGGRRVNDPFLLLPDPGMFVRHPILASPMHSEWLLPVHYMPMGAYDIASQYSGVRYFRRRYQLDATSSDPFDQGFAKISAPNEGLVEPNLVWVTNKHYGPSLICYLRSRAADASRRFIYRSSSRDGGHTWEQPKRTRLPNVDRAFQASAIPGADGRVVVLFVNSARVDRWGPMSIALSEDNGATFPWVRDLSQVFHDRHVYADPSVTVTDDGRIHVAYTLDGNIRYASVYPDWIKDRWDEMATRGDYPHMV